LDKSQAHNIGLKRFRPWIEGKMANSV